MMYKLFSTKKKYTGVSLRCENFMNNKTWVDGKYYEQVDVNNKCSKKTRGRTENVEKSEKLFF